MEVTLRLKPEEARFFLLLNVGDPPHNYDNHHDSGVGVLPLNYVQGDKDRVVGLTSLEAAFAYLERGYPFRGWTCKSGWTLWKENEWTLKLWGTRHSIRKNWLPHHWVHAEKYPSNMEEYKKYEVLSYHTSEKRWLWWETRDEAVERLALELYRSFRNWALAKPKKAGEGAPSWLLNSLYEVESGWNRKREAVSALFEPQYTRAGSLAPYEDPQGFVTWTYEGQKADYALWAKRQNEEAPKRVLEARIEDPRLIEHFGSWCSKGFPSE